MANYTNVINNNVNVSGEAEIEKLRKELIAARDENERLNNSLNNTIVRLDEMTRKYNDFAHGNGLEILNQELERFKDTAVNATYEFRAFLESVNLNDSWGKNDARFAHLFDQIEDGTKTAGQAIMEVKTKFGYLIEQANDGIDSKGVQQFNATLEKLANTINDVSVRMRSIEENGVRTIGGEGGGGGGNITAVLDKITASAENMSEETKVAYEHITNLVKSISDYASLDDTKLLGVSQAFRNLAEVGKGSYGTKSIENIISLVKQLQGIAPDGVLKLGLDLTGLQDVKVSKASLRNLADYLPIIAKVNVNKLKELSNVDFTNFNNLKVSKGAVEEISKIANAVQILKEAKAASVSVGDKGIGINESAKQAAKGYADYVKEHMRQEAEFQKQVNQDILQSNKQRAAEEINFSKQVTQQKKADQQSYNAYVKQHMQEEAQFEKDLTQAKKADQKSYNAYVKQQTQGEAAFQKQLAQEQSVTEKQRITYLKRATTLLNQMQQAEQNWTKAGATGSKSGGAYQGIKDGVVQLNKCLEDLNNKKITLDEFNQKVNELGLSFKVNSAEIRAAGENTQTFTDRIGKLSSKFGAWLSITRIIMGVIRTIKQMVKAVVEIDSAMTQLQIVTKATNDQMAKFGETAANTAKQIGSTITDFTSSVTTFARLGLT